MAFNAATQWEFRTTGDNANGGGFYDATPGTSVDYSSQNAAQHAYTDLVIDAATNTKITSAARPFAAADAGNIISVTGGTGFTVQRVQIVSVDGSAVATCDKAVGTVGSTGGTGNFGGSLALLTDAILESFAAGNKGWLKTGTYTLTENISIARDGTAAAVIELEGYQTTRGDRPYGDNRPLIIAGAYTLTWGSGGQYWKLKNIRGTSTASLGFSISQYGAAENCKCVNNSTVTWRYAFAGYANTRIIECEAISINGGGIICAAAGLVIDNSYCHDSYVGIVGNNNNSTYLSNSIISACSYESIDLVAAALWVMRNNTLYGSANKDSIGIAGTTSSGHTLIGNIIAGFSVGISISNAYSDHVFRRNNFYDNTTDVSGVTKDATDIALDPGFAAVDNQGSNLCTNGADWTSATGATPPTDWAVVTAGTFTITAGGESGDYLKIEHDGTHNNPSISYAISTTAGKSYAIEYRAQKGTATNATAKVGTTSGGEEMGITKTHTDTDWLTKKRITFEAVGTTTYFSVGATTSTTGQYSMIDSVTIYEQGEDFTPGVNMKLDIDWTRMGC